MSQQLLAHIAAQPFHSPKRSVLNGADQRRVLAAYAALAEDDGTFASPPDAAEVASAAQIPEAEVDARTAELATEGWLCPLPGGGWLVNPRRALAP